MFAKKSGSKITSWVPPISLSQLSFRFLPHYIRSGLSRIIFWFDHLGHISGHMGPLLAHFATFLVAFLGCYWARTLPGMACINDALAFQASCWALSGVKIGICVLMCGLRKDPSSETLNSLFPPGPLTPPFSQKTTQKTYKKKLSPIPKRRPPEPSHLV